MDRIIEELNGVIENEFQFGDINLSKELQKNVIELVPAVPQTSIAELERVLFDGMSRFHRATENGYKLLGLGMHPLLTLDQTAYWDHEDKELYDEYDRIFNLRQHGWLNIQALQVNIHFEGEEHMVRMFNQLRSLIPYLVAVTASSPMVEGRLTNVMDNRLLYYRENQMKVPLICNNIIPERLTSAKQHDQIIESIYVDLRKVGGDMLCHEWIDSRGVIVRYPRSCLELKATDEQECIRSDMALTAFVLALLRANLRMEKDHDTLLELNEKAIRHGTADLRPELRRLFREAYKSATPEERNYLPIIKTRIENGSVAEVMRDRIMDGEDIREILDDMATCLRTNTPSP